ncbi:hypothetical protein [Methanosphaera sp. BMS]|uniref:hypothetical protein n=1 Tax=Methanosphaera sp. BMS TaxID=1789762 RepID=UPI000DC1DBEF|nr:hypothetical protein [Methanosphaera sp. BMS]AWX32326.1 hypothetical protein AW729_04040 [Methanosphaera sp. BMS]
MNKKSILVIIALLAVIGIVVLLLGNSHSENSGNLTPDDSTLTFKYNNDYSSSFFMDYGKGGSDSAYYDNKTLNGSLTLDLDRISWDANYTPTNQSAKSDADYAKEHFVEDITKDFNTLKKEVNITYYDENKSVVDVVDYSVEQDPIANNMSLDSNKLKVDLSKDYQKDYVTEITDGSTVKTPIIAGNATKTNTIKSAKVVIKLSNDKYCYILNVDVPGDKLKVEHQ